MKKDDETSLIEEYYKRSSYRSQSYFVGDKKHYFIDTLQSDPYYGRYNEEFRPVLPNTDSEFRNLKTFGDYADLSQRALPFVVDAFNNFRDEYFQALQRSSTSEPSYFENVAPAKSYESFSEAYNKYYNNFIAMAKRSLYKRTSRRMTPAQNFNVLMMFLEENIKTFPITYSGFLLSKHCPISVTGLSVELATLDHGSHAVKNNLLNTDGYECFMENAYNNGFLIDMNNPWRLIANLNSEHMKKYIESYRPNTSARNIISHLFRKKTEYEDIYAVYKVLRDLMPEFANYPLTSLQIIEYTMTIRVMEVGGDMGIHQKDLKRAKDLYGLYSTNFSDPFKGSNSMIGDICATYIYLLAERRKILRNKTGAGSIRDYDLKKPRPLERGKL